jgi:predicted  nucleic acid-binding Zn-ribbon protein
LTFQIRHLRLRSYTATNAYGADLEFTSGFNVLRAENTSGKSTALQGILYALAMERALGPKLEIPLPYAMRERIHQHENEPYETVVQSYVELEISDGGGRTAVIRRDVEGGRDRRLLRVWEGGHVRDAERASPKDYFVHQGGAAVNEAGFHTFLANFIGWDLPKVLKYDGGEAPLYLETIFPMFFIEQKRGWSAVQGPFPTYLQIQDMGRRVMEFLLDLEVARTRRQRAELRRQIDDLTAAWKREIQAITDRASYRLQVKGLPAAPTAEIKDAEGVEAYAYHQGEWVPIQQLLSELRQEIQEISTKTLPSAEASSVEATAALKDAQGLLTDQTARREAIKTEYLAQNAEHREFQTRVATLQRDLTRNKDALRLKKLGSDLGASLTDDTCPTCHQLVETELLPQAHGVAMGLEENITFIESQLALYQAAEGGARERLSQLSTAYAAITAGLDEIRSTIRGLKQSLVQASGSPSRALVERQVALQAKVDQLAYLQESLDESLDELKALGGQWAELRERLRQLGPDQLTDADLEKISLLESLIQERLRRYGFRSFQPSEVKLSRDNFRTVRCESADGYIVEREINFELSASDAIRLKWAYYFSLLLVGNRLDTNHPRLLIFDEPGQQEVRKDSLLSFMDELSRSVDSKGQVIVATSADRSHIEPLIARGSANILNFDEYILQPLA